MKIAIDISQIIYGTGVSVYTKSLVESLIKKYPDDAYILFGSSLRQRAVLEEFVQKTKAASKTYPFPPSLLDFVWNSLHLFPIDRLIGDCDVVHTSDWTEPPSNIPKVTTVHDLVPLKFPETSTEEIRRVHKKRLSWVKKESSQIIAVSQSTKSDLINLLQIPEEKITVIYEGVEERYSPQSPAMVDVVKRRYHIDGDYLFSLSTLEPRKNRKRLIEAFRKIKSKLPDTKLVIAGKKGWGSEEEIVDPDIIYTGFVPDIDLPALYSGALCYTLPSLYEGFSLSQLQAMACGTPVVTSNTSSMPEIIGEAGILVDPLKVDDIATGIIEAVNHRAELIEKGLIRAKKFTWSKTAQETHKVYELVTK